MCRRLSNRETCDGVRDRFESHPRAQSEEAPNTVADPVAETRETTSLAGRRDPSLDVSENSTATPEGTAKESTNVPDDSTATPEGTTKESTNVLSIATDTPEGASTPTSSDGSAPTGTQPTDALPEESTKAEWHQRTPDAVCALVTSSVPRERGANPTRSTNPVRSGAIPAERASGERPKPSNEHATGAIPRPPDRQLSGYGAPHAVTATPTAIREPKPSNNRPR